MNAAAAPKTTTKADSSQPSNRSGGQRISIVVQEGSQGIPGWEVSGLIRLGEKVG
jgi:hypothetical protein